MNAETQASRQVPHTSWCSPTMLLTAPARERLESHDNALSLRLFAFLIAQRAPRERSLDAAD